MATTQVDTLDTDTVARLSDAFHRSLETQEVEDGVFAPDALFDLYPPFWRFQIQGPDAFEAQLRSVAEPPVELTVLRVVPTGTGFVSETEETHHGGKVETARHLWLCEVRDGLITEVVSYCNGGWDDELKARHAAEAPMIRP